MHYLLIFEYFTIEHLECLNGQSIYAGKDADFIQYNVSIGYKGELICHVC